MTRMFIYLAPLVAFTLSFATTVHSQTLTTLYSFEGQPADGLVPCGVGPGPDGSLVGTTQAGGMSDYGSVFRIDAGGSERLLHNFSGSDDGLQPCAPLSRGPDGAWYGTTTYGGNGFNGFGTVFRIQGKSFTTIHTFTGLDGAFPFAGLLLNVDGVLYGTTGQGGTGLCPGGCGTIFKVDTEGNVTVLYSFNGPDGAYPSSALIHDANGNLYGTTLGGGLNKSDMICPEGCGTVFRLDTAGKLRVIYRFRGGTTDGWYLVSGVVRDTEGNLYGTTNGGGSYGLGTIYEITIGGVEKLLHSFQGVPDGADPESLVRDRDGNLFGASYGGGSADCTEGAFGCGTIFEFDATGTESVLYQFSGDLDGAEPSGPVFLDAEGNLYGTTAQGIQDGCAGFPYGCGTVWKLAVGSAH